MPVKSLVAKPETRINQTHVNFTNHRSDDHSQIHANASKTETHKNILRRSIPINRFIEINAKSIQKHQMKDNH